MQRCTSEKIRLCKLESSNARAPKNNKTLMSTGHRRDQRIISVTMSSNDKLMKRLLVVLAMIGTPIQAQSFQELDRVDGWLIERKLSNEQEPICRASMMNGGNWFSARVHLNRNDELVVPDGLRTPKQSSIDAAREALRLCRSDLLYF